MIWVLAGTRTLGRGWFLSLSAMAVLISSAMVFGALRHPHSASAGIILDARICGFVVTLEMVGIAFAFVILRDPERKKYLLPVIALIVGAHFFGMVPALHSNEFWWVGGAICLLPILTISILPERLWAPVVGDGLCRDLVVLCAASILDLAAGHLKLQRASGAARTFQRRLHTREVRCTPLLRQRDREVAG